MSLVSRDVPIRYEPDFWPSCYDQHLPMYRDPVPYQNQLSRYDDFYMPYGFESRPLMRSQMWSSFEQEMARMNEEMKRNWDVSRRMAVGNFTKMGDNFLAPSAENWRLMENFRMDNPIIEDNSGRRKFYLEYDTSQFKPEEITVKTSGQQLTVHAKHEEKDENRSSRKEYQRSYLLPQETMFTLPTQEVYTTPVPVPQDPAGNIKDDCRLWIGNLDTRLTEYTLLKLLQKFGELKRFDFLLNKLGPEKGKPRGYCFVSYENRKDAEKAKRNMHGKLALSKRLVVKWAHAETESEHHDLRVPYSTTGVYPTGSTDSQIRAIEDKLRKMEESSSEFTISTKPVAQPGSSQLYQMNAAKQEQIKKPYSRKK